MNERSFFDSNLLVYTDDQNEPDKQRIALQFDREWDCLIIRVALRSGCSVLLSEAGMLGPAHRSPSTR